MKLKRRKLWMNCAMINEINEMHKTCYEIIFFKTERKKNKSTKRTLIFPPLTVNVLINT